MAHAIYATFATEADAEKAAGALLDHGVATADISFVLPDHTSSLRSDSAGHPILDAPPGVTSTVPRHPDDLPILNAGVPQFAGTPGVINSQSGTPAYNAPEGLASGVLNQELDVLPRPVTVVSPASAIPTGGAEAGLMVTPTPTVTNAATDPATTAAIPANTPIDTVAGEHRTHIVDQGRELPDAARGITTTTPGDAGKGALEGAGVGAGLGLLLGLAAIAIPGIGWVAGAGMLVAGLTAATGAAGGVAGGVFGYLSDMGVSSHHTDRLHTHLHTGGPVLSVNITDRIPQQEIVSILEKYGSTSAEAF